MKNSIKIMFLFIGLTCSSVKNYAQVSVGIGLSVRIAPPPLPVYEQPPCPADGYLWTPGYWAYGDDSYYWVPGVWVRPPYAGVLWTPGYWGFEGGYYGWHRGYWGPHIGFYGGVNYGYGYTGVGFCGGGWSGSIFRYNTAVVRVNTTVVHNTYIDRTVINNTVVNNRVSYNGPGGLSARPRPEERMAMNERHFQPTTLQTSHEYAAVHDRRQMASPTGRPATMSMNRVNPQHFSSQAQPANNNRSFGQNGQRPNGGGFNQSRSERVNRQPNVNRQTGGFNRARSGGFQGEQHSQRQFAPRQQGGGGGGHSQHPRH